MSLYYLFHGVKKTIVASLLGFLKNKNVEEFRENKIKKTKEKRCENRNNNNKNRKGNGLPLSRPAHML